MSQSKRRKEEDTTQQRENEAALLAAQPLFSGSNNMALLSYGGRKSTCDHKHELRGATDPGSPQYRYMRELFALIVLEAAKDHSPPIYVLRDGSIPLPYSKESEAVDNFNARWLTPIVRPRPHRSTTTENVVLGPGPLTASLRNLNVHQFLQAHEMEFFSRTCKYYRSMYNLKQVIPTLARRCLRDGQLFNLGFMLEPYSAECDHHPDCPGDYYLATLLGGRADMCYHARILPLQPALDQLQLLGYRIDPRADCSVSVSGVQDMVDRICGAVSTIPLINNPQQSRVLDDILTQRRRKFRIRFSYEISVTGSYIAIGNGDVAVRCSVIRDFDTQLIGLIMHTRVLREVLSSITREFNDGARVVHMPLQPSNDGIVFLPRGIYSQVQTLTWLNTMSAALRQN